MARPPLIEYPWGVYRAVGEGEPIVSGAHVEIPAELVIARGDLGGASPLGFSAGVLSAILDESASEALDLSGELVEFPPLMLLYGLPGEHQSASNDASIAPADRGASVGVGTQDRATRMPSA